MGSAVIANAVDLAWDPSPDAQVPGAIAGYKLYYGTNSASYIWTNVFVGNVTNAVVSQATLDPTAATHYFSVTAYNSSGVESDPASLLVYGQIITFPPIGDKIFGSPPVTLVATGGGSSSPVIFSLVSGPATLTDSTLTLTGPGTVIVKASQAGDSTHLAALDVINTFQVIVGMSAQSITFPALTERIYGSPPITLSAIGGGSTAPVIFTLMSGPAILAGNVLTLTGTGTVTVKASQAGDANFYAAPDVINSFQVIKASQTITFLPLTDKTYGTPPIALSATGGNSTSPVTFAVVSGPATLAGNLLSLTGIGTIAVKASQAGDANYNAAPDVINNFQVLKASQTITFPPLAEQTYGGSPITLNATGGNSTAPVTFAVVSGPATLAGNILTLTGVGTIAVKASQAGDANYNAAPDVINNFQVLKASQTIIFPPLAEQTYGGSPVTLNATGGNSTSPVTFAVVSGPATLAGNVLTLTGAGIITVKASQAGDANYNAAPDVSNSFQILKASQTITFPPLAEQTYGGSPITLSATGGNSTSPVTFAVVSGPATLAGNILTLTGAGTIAIKASQTGDANYNAAPDVINSVQVLKANQTITFPALAEQTYGNPPLNLNATGGNSTAPVTFALVSGPATLAGNILTITGAGTIAVKASQAGDANYNAAPDVINSVQVLKASQTITFPPLADQTYGNPPLTLNATGGNSTAPVTFALVSGPATLAGNILTITGAGTIAVKASQAGDANYNAAPDVINSVQVLKASQTITFPPLANPTYGNPPITLSATGGGSTAPVSFALVSGPATLTGNILTLTGAGTIAVKASQAGDANYNTAPDVINSVQVLKASQTITFPPIADQTYASQSIALNANGGGSTAPVILTLVSGPARLAGNILTITGTGTISVKASQAGDANYNAAPDVIVSFRVLKASRSGRDAKLQSQNSGIDQRTVNPVPLPTNADIALSASKTMTVQDLLSERVNAVGIPPRLMLSISNEQALLTIFGVEGATYNILRQTSLVGGRDWIPSAELNLTNPPQMWTDPQPCDYATRFYQITTPYDYAILADMILKPGAYQTRLIEVRLPSLGYYMVCYVPQEAAYLEFDPLSNTYKLVRSGSTIREVATKVAVSLNENWTSASEFAVANGLKEMLATVVKTDPPQFDPVAGARNQAVTVGF